MKGLLIKDILNLKKQASILILFALFYLILAIASGDTAFFGGLTSILCIMLPITALSYDERAKWEVYALSMPISRKDIIISKYLLGVLTAAIAFVLTIIVNLFTMDDTKEALALAYTFVAIGMLFISIMLPILFKFGTEKARMIMLIVFLVPFGIGILLPKLNIQPPSEQTLTLLFKLSPIFLIIIFFLSIFISIRIYEKKEIQ